MDSIIETSCVTEHDTVYDDKQTKLGGVWVWGINLLTMLKHDYLLQLRIGRAILYQGKYLYKHFIESFYEKRLQAKADGDAVGDNIFKIMMNSLYGKTG